MIDRELVDRLREERKISKTAFPKLIGMSNTGYNQMWENHSIKVDTLDKMAKILEVPVTYLVDPQSGLASEEHTTYDDIQAKLLSFMEKLESLYERLLAAEAEKAQLLLELQEARSKTAAS